MEEEYVQCILCNQDNTELALKLTKNVIVVTCRNCGLMYQNPRQIDISYYDEKFFESCVQRYDAQRQFSENRFDSLLAVIKAGWILDIGCGTGGFLAVAQKRGWDCYGVDVSRYAANYANCFLKNEVRIGTVEDANSQNHFLMLFIQEPLWNIAITH